MEQNSSLNTFNPLNTPNLVSHESIKKIFTPYFDKNQFEELVFDYMANMILEDQPDNEHDLRSLIGDYLSDQLKYSEEKKHLICKEILEQLYKIGFKGERKAILAERLDRAIKLGEMKVGSENTITSLSFDPNQLTFEKDKYYAQDIQNVKKEEYKPDKEKIDAMKKHLEEVRKMKESISEIQIHHDRDESHKVDIIIPNFTISIGGRTLIDDASLKISYGRRYVFIGRNGIGKTTLLNHIVKKEIDGIPKHLQILHVEQEVASSDRTLIEEVLSCDVERNRLIKELDEVTNLINAGSTDKAHTDKMLHINKRLQDINADEAEPRAISILSGLGFYNEDLSKPTKNFSGGWRMRISLAKALFVQPDILLLDEPTNHLDMNAVMWLEDYLVTWPYTLVVVSHARDFINSIATDIFHLTNQKLYYYKGNYDEFERARTEKMKLLSKAKVVQDRKLDHMQSFIDKFRANAKRASMVQSRIKAMNKIEIVEEIMEDPTCIFVFPVPEKLNPPILRLDNVDLGYGNTHILNKANFSVDMSARIAVVGPNGAGKTTLLKCLTNELQPSGGIMYRHNKLKLAMFTQHHLDQLDLELSPIEQIAKMYSDLSSEVIRSHLASFGITGNLALRPNYLLSGGQKSRVALAALVYQNPHIMLMDEPTNHLDIDAVNALALALNSYNGGLVIVSHDQHFVESVCNQIYVVKDKKCTYFKGTFLDYKKHLRSIKSSH
jgi:ATP-binding cassette subfamily F protein 3